jgi:hypothetical protein
MYIVKIENEGIENTIHGKKEKLKSGNIVKGINTIDSFSFTMLPSNVGFDKLFDLKTLINVYNTNKKRYEFWGRVLMPHDSMDASGLITKEVVCESYFGFFCDSEQEYVEEKNWTVDGLLNHIVDCHNSQVEDYKKFVVGIITVTDPNDNLYVGIQRENTWDTLQSKLVGKLGGELVLRVENGVNYVDYLKEAGARLSTEIAISKNMKSISRENDPTEYITQLVPLGRKLTKEVETTDTEGNVTIETVETEERLDISSVNNGVKYIEDENARKVYGIRRKSVIFDDVTDASNLLRKGKEWLAENNRVKIKYNVTALDLSLLGLEMNDFDVCNYHPIKNPLLGIDDVARIIKKNIDICEEIKSNFDIGDNLKTLSDIQAEQIGKLENINQSINTIQTTTNNLKNHVSSVQSALEGGMDQNTEDLKQIIVEQSTILTNTCEEIVLQALEAYTETGDFGEFKRTVESQLQLLADEMNLRFTETTQQIIDSNGVLQEQLNTISKYFTFSIDGLIIGQSDNPFKVVIDNDRYSMLVNDVEVLWLDPEGKSNIPELTVQKELNLFGYVISEDENGNVNCVYEGGVE